MIETLANSSPKLLDGWGRTLCCLHICSRSKNLWWSAPANIHQCPCAHTSPSPGMHVLMAHLESGIDGLRFVYSPNYTKMWYIHPWTIISIHCVPTQLEEACGISEIQSNTPHLHHSTLVVHHVWKEVEEQEGRTGKRKGQAAKGVVSSSSIS